MSKVVKYLITGTIITGVGLLINKIGKGIKAQNVAESLVMDFKNPKVSIIGIKEIKISVDLIVKNPLKKGITLTKPFFKVLHGNNTVGSSSSLMNNTYPISPMSETTLPNNKVTINDLTLVMSVISSQSTKVKLFYSIYGNGFYKEITKEFDLKDLI